MAFLDMILRFGAISLLAVLALLSWRDIKQSQARFIMVGLCVSTLAMLLSHVPDYADTPHAVFVFGRIFDIPNLIFIWLFGFQIFDDGFKIKPIHTVASLAYILPVCVTRSHDLGLFPPIPHWYIVVIDLYAIGIILYLLYVILKGRGDDLVNARRRVRIYFVLALIGITLFATMADMIRPGFHLTVANWAKVFATLPLTVWAYLWITSLHPEKLLFKPVDRLAPAIAPKIDPRDNLLLEKLQYAMESDHAYTEPGLTIRSLAEKLKTPEHRLRVLINKGMGYRNFSAFLNGYRIEAVKRAFQDPANARIPVLTIALDQGYNSLAPFNRAFRDSEGMTPSAFRQKITFNPD